MKVMLFSRTLDDISAQFPEIIKSALDSSGSFILDGEVVALIEGRIQPFQVLQKRLGRKQLTQELLSGAPAGLFAFDLLCLDGDAYMERPLCERRRALESMRFARRIFVAPAALLSFALMDALRFLLFGK